MTRDDHEYQAMQFMAFHRKRRQSLEDDFGTWARSKEFKRRDYIAIKTIVVNELTANGVAQELVLAELGYAPLKSAS